MTSSPVDLRVSELIEIAAETRTTPGAFNAAVDELNILIREDPAALQAAYRRRDEIISILNHAKIEVAGVSAHLAVAMLAAAKPVPVATRRPDLARGPATEVALAAFHILRYAGDIIPINGDDIEAALDSPGDPEFGSYPALFAAVVGHIRVAAYYLLDPSDSFAALASEPPQEETFPPLPFPRVWIEMKHLTPYLRFVDDSGEGDRKWAIVDVLGVGIAEVEPGRVWDVLVPFDFGEPEFFVVGARIAPDRVIDADSALVELGATFDSIRALAVGGAHLITARNVPVERVVFPRAQRRRMSVDEQQRTSRVYFVNLAGSGERDAGGPAGTGREYHFRWLVRGHWRHVDSGQSFCTCCDPQQVATWIAPYVKGPVGSPWKGKQVRR